MLQVVHPRPLHRRRLPHLGWYHLAAIANPVLAILRSPWFCISVKRHSWQVAICPLPRKHLSEHTLITNMQRAKLDVQLQDEWSQHTVRWVVCP